MSCLNTQSGYQTAPSVMCTQIATMSSCLQSCKTTLVSHLWQKFQCAVIKMSCLNIQSGCLTVPSMTHTHNATMFLCLWSCKTMLLSHLWWTFWLCCFQWMHFHQCFSALWSKWVVWMLKAASKPLHQWCTLPMQEHFGVCSCVKWQQWDICDESFVCATFSNCVFTNISVSCDQNELFWHSKWLPNCAVNDVHSQKNQCFCVCNHVKWHQSVICDKICGCVTFSNCIFTNISLCSDQMSWLNTKSSCQTIPTMTCICNTRMFWRLHSCKMALVRCLWQMFWLCCFCWLHFHHSNLSWRDQNELVDHSKHPSNCSNNHMHLPHKNVLVFAVMQSDNGETFVTFCLFVRLLAIAFSPMFQCLVIKMSCLNTQSGHQTVASIVCV